MTQPVCFVVLLLVFTILKPSYAIINAEIVAPTPTLNGVKYILSVSDKFPSMVELLKNGQHLCGGALIHPNVVITVARCISMNSSVPHLGLYYLLMGNQIKNVEAKPWFFQRRNITRVMFHPEWPTDEAADLALLRPSLPFKFSLYADVIALHEPNYYRNFSEGRVYGWGFTEKNIYSTVLRTLEMDIQLEDKCAAYLTNSTRQICLTKKNSNPCFGDFGGPVVGQLSSSKNRYLIGLISYVPGARIPGDPTKVDCFTDKKTVAIRIASFVDWINAPETLFNLTMYD